MNTFNFHHNYALDRKRLSNFVRCIAEGKATSNEAIGAFIGINPYAVRSLRGWLYHTGLGSGKANTYMLSDFGKLTVLYDPYLELPGTSWILHYHLASYHLGRAEIWYRFFNEFAFVGRQFSRKELYSYLERTLTEIPGKKTALADNIGALLTCYTQSLALGGLEIIHRCEKSRYDIRHGRRPDLLIVAYALFDCWNRLFPGYDTLRLSQLHEESEMIGRMFLLTRNQVLEYVQILQSRGLLVFTDTQHEPVSRRFHESPLLLLERYYQENG